MLLPDIQILNNGKSRPVTRPYSPKISSKCPRWTFLLRPETTITRWPPFELLPFPFARTEFDLDLDLDLERDIETSDPRRLRGGGEGESDFGVRERPRSLSGMVMMIRKLMFTKGMSQCTKRAWTSVEQTL